jgi:hypothetical protein
MEVKIEGKMRPVSPFNGSIPNVNMIPDAYKVTLTINSLCPNNYNMFLNFLNTSYKYVSDTPTSTRLDALHAAANPATASGGLAKNITTGIVNGAFEVIL